MEAGYSRRSAKHTAHQLLHENKLVRAELERVRQHLAETTEYNGERCMAECSEAIQRAIANKNDNAVARLIETKARLAGLLRDKIDLTVEQKVDLTDALAAAKSRVVRSMCDLPPPIDGQFVALPSAADVRPPD